jgi:glycerol-1-phosphate dehydrogenase [NAD(P)+]
VYIEANATKHLKDICKSHNNILLVADDNTYNAAGEKTVSALASKNINKVIFSGEKILVPNEDAIETVTNHLNNTDLIVGIGSGVIQDLCKYVSFQNKIPYIIVATAPSMDGYASNGAAMITGGMKATYSAGLPIAIIADTEVLKNAPIDMIKAGYGDIIGKYSALNDWKLSHLINQEYFCEYIYNLTYNQIERTLKLADGILKRNEQSIKTLMEALVIIGILMSFATSSRPASGSEHHLSHFFEITGIVDNAPYFPHGIDVAYSTVITAEIREKIIKNKFPNKIYRQTKTEYTEIMNLVYKQVANGCIALQEKIGNYTLDRLPVYLEKENEIKKIISEMPSATEINDMLLLAELDINEFYSLYGKEKIENAILYAKDLKDRYTVLWVNYDLFGEDLFL